MSDELAHYVGEIENFGVPPQVQAAQGYLNFCQYLLGRATGMTDKEQTAYDAALDVITAYLKTE